MTDPLPTGTTNTKAEAEAAEAYTSTVDGGKEARVTQKASVPTVTVDGEEANEAARPEDVTRDAVVEQLAG